MQTNYRALRASFIVLIPILSLSSRVFSEPATAGVRLPFVFSDNMVLQRDLADPVWGDATAGAKITVRFANQQKSATADDAGHWMLKLDPMPADTQGQSLSVTDTADTTTFTNVLVGEIWLCSGQSNMEKPLGIQTGQAPTINYQQEIANADHPLIRLLTVPKVKKASDIKTNWEICTPTTIARERFSAMAYFFGRKLQQDLNVPVGLIHSSWGGTRIEPWTNPQGFAMVPAVKGLPAHWTAPTTRPGQFAPSGLYNAMIQPLVPFGIRGSLWYQGEGNVVVHDQAAYFPKMQALIGGWRQAWSEGDFPFYFVQLAPFAYTARSPKNSDPNDLPELWEAQLKSLAIPHTGMAVITDLVPNVHDIHPTRKREVGERLALWALAKDYGKTDIEYSGPLFKSLEVKRHDAIVHFDHAQGLKTRDGKAPADFEIAAVDGKFTPGDARIEGDTVVVTSPDVSQPAAVRFAWNETAQPNLENAADLPASPFRSDR